MESRLVGTDFTVRNDGWVFYIVRIAAERRNCLSYRTVARVHAVRIAKVQGPQEVSCTYRVTKRPNSMSRKLTRPHKFWTAVTSDVYLATKTR
eukprot:scaffold593_cov382-Prasinococcus_capsulatus_cf.AAC.3